MRQEDLNSHGLVNSFEGDAAQDAPEGEEDIRVTSRAQREVWKNNMHLASVEDRERFQYLKSKDCTDKGKEKEANKIINAYVPRDSGWGGSLRPKTLTLKRIHNKVDTEEDATQVKGMKLHTFIGKVFAGSKALFEEAKQANEIYEEGDMWYTVTKSRRKSSLVETATKFEEKHEFEDKSEFLKAIMGNLTEEGSLSKWTKAIEKKAMALQNSSTPKRHGADDPVTDKTMALLQESNDGYTRISLAIKRIGSEIINNREVSSKDTMRDMRQRSIDVLKGLVPTSNDIEKALFSTPRDELTETKTIRLVQAACEPYAAAWQFYREMIAVFEAAGGMSGMPTGDIKRIRRELK